MDRATVANLVAHELATGIVFSGSHGISPDNVIDFAVDPYLVLVDPDDLETSPREMWVVLQQLPSATEGYLIALDPLTLAWVVAEYVGDGNFQAIVSAPSLSEALEGM